jgi:hypothetical protein
VECSKDRAERHKEYADNAAKRPIFSYRPWHTSGLDMESMRDAFYFRFQHVVAFPGSLDITKLLQMGPNYQAVEHQRLDVCFSQF